MDHWCNISSSPRYARDQRFIFESILHQLLKALCTGHIALFITTVFQTDTSLTDLIPLLNLNLGFLGVSVSVLLYLEYSVSVHLLYILHSCMESSIKYLWLTGPLVVELS